MQLYVVPRSFLSWVMLKLIPIKLLLNSVQDRMVLRALSLSFSVKARYRSSQYHRFTYSRIADEYHIGRDKAKKLIAILIEMNLATIQDGNILFGKFKQERGKQVSLLPYNNIDLYNLSDIEKYLRLQAVSIKQSQIDYMTNRIQHLRDPGTLKEFKSARKVMGNYNWVGEADRGQSINTVSSVSGLGKNKAVDLLKWGEAKGLLSKQKRITPISYYLLPEGRYNRSTVFTWRGQKYRAQTTLLSFLVL